ncbi:MAG: Wzz/FepE/Etk N-terminal domain-containing protein [Waddliaceae bacterium]
MAESNHRPEDFLITISDLIRILRRAKGKILFSVIVFSLLTVLYPLLQPIQYSVEATFKEKGNQQAEVNNSSSLVTMVLGGFAQGNSSEAISMMLSRKLLQGVVQSLNLQAAITKKRDGSSLLKRMKDNLRVEYNRLRKKAALPFPDIHTAIEVRDVEYSGEIPIDLTLVFDSEDTYQVIGPEEEKLGHGKLQTPFSSENFRFTIEKAAGFPLCSDTYSCTLSPIADVAKKLSEEINIEQDKDDQTLLKFRYRNRSRHLASDVLNQLMFLYQDYLRHEQRRISGEQVAYLHKRQKEMGKDLKEVLEAHANRVSSDVSSLGYANSEAALHFLTSKMQEVKEKLLTIDLELKRLKRFKQDNGTKDFLYHIQHAPHVLNEVLEKIQKLKNHSDSIELALHQSSGHHQQHEENAFSQHLIDLDKMRKCGEEARLMISYLENDRYPLPQVSLLDDCQLMIKTWHKELEARQRELINAPVSEKEEKGTNRKNFQAQFIAYLHHFIHFLDVREKAIRERLVRQQSSQLEFQGINLDTAKDLYLNYSEQLGNVEAQILQLEYIVDQLEEPGFEISSLSGVTTDSVTADLVSKASYYVLALQDDMNRGVKEKERLKTELETHKRFLDLHLRQTIQLLQLRKGLIKEKVYSLQSTTLELIQQQISILEKQLEDTLGSHIHHLKEEQQLIEQYQLDFRHEMALLPRQWVTEKLIDQQITMDITMMEELTKLVESKSIASHLDAVQSAPVDIAIPSPYPESPKVIFFMLLGAFLGSFLSMGLLFAHAMITSVPASKENLELSEVHVSGVMKKHCKENLPQLRRFISFLDLCHSSEERFPQTLAFIKGKGDDYSKDIAKLFSKQGLHVLLLDLTFEKEPEQEQLPGLLQFLEGKVKNPKIHHFGWYDAINSGGVCHFSHEYMGSTLFSQLIHDLKTRYDWVIGITHASPISPEVDTFIRFFDHSLINVHRETRRELAHVIELAKHLSSKKKVSFMVIE